MPEGDREHSNRPDGRADDGVTADGAPPGMIPTRRSPRRFAPFLAGAVAVVLLLAGALIIGAFDDPAEQSVLVALHGTDDAPGASADAEIADTPAGARIVLTVEDLPPAPDGAYYQAWLQHGSERAVSAGTFHLRGGDAEIELRAGVSLDDYPLVAVTLQREGDGAAPSDVVVLRSTTD